MTGKTENEAYVYYGNQDKAWAFFKILDANHQSLG